MEPRDEIFRHCYPSDGGLVVFIDLLHLNCAILSIRLARASFCEFAIATRPLQLCGSQSSYQTFPIALHIDEFQIHAILNLVANQPLCLQNDESHKYMYQPLYLFFIVTKDPASQGGQPRSATVIPLRLETTPARRATQDSNNEYCITESDDDKQLHCA